ncbi:MAG: copper chaperone PCu(A)C [Novosphingobium sp.]|nr:copper chaperone PCu(A)C [Novosphingobium sp.]
MKLSYLAPLAALALASCNQGPASSADETPVAGQLSVTGGKLVLPAVSGNPGAAYFTVTNGTKQPASLAAATVEGASKAEMHESMAGSMQPLTVLTLGPGAAVTFEPGGKHVMVFGVPQSLKAGGTSKITLTFSGGQTASGPLQVAAPGGGDMH